MAKLTPEEKLKKQKRDNLSVLINGVKSAWSFGSLKTWLDVYNRLGYDDRYIATTFTQEQRLKALTYPELAAYLKTLQDEQERKLNELTRSNETEAGIRKDQSCASKNGSCASKNGSNSNFIEVVVRKDGASDLPSRNGNENETELNNSNDYGLVPSPNEKAFHYWFQKKAIKEALDLILEGKSCLIIAGTGKGKTFITYGIARRLIDIGFHDDKTLSHTPYLVLTRTTIKEQHRRVAKNFYNLTEEDIEVNNIEVVRSKAGKFWIRTKEVIVDGEPDVVFEWKNGIHPCVVFFDESQAAKNNDKSKQARIMCAYNDLPKNNILVSISATPFTRVSEAKCFAVSTHANLEPLGFPKGSVLTNKNWASFASSICEGLCNPEDYNETAVGRLMKFLDKYVVRVKGVKSQFNEDNKIEKMEFQSEEARIFYANALKRMQEQKAKLERDKSLGVTPSVHPFAIITAFSKAAELCRAEPIADRMYQSVQKGYAACAAVKFKSTLIAIEQCLEKKYGVERDNISLIWGGGQTELTAKQKAKQKLKENRTKLEATGLDVDELMEDMELTDVEDRELLKLPTTSRLGPQDLFERQKEIDKFQSGKSLYCLYTFKAGGVGLSLHHTDELCDDWNRNVPGFDEWFNSLTKKQKENKGKIPRKESGYAYEDGIKFCFTRPRKNIVAPTYSAIELVQGLGRCPRLTSLSNTEQTLLFYSGTIEDDIAAIVAEKLRCLSFVVRMKESWQDMILGGVSKDAYLDTTKNVATDTEGAGNVEAEETEDNDEE